MRVIEDDIPVYVEGNPTIMISSSMYGFKDQILTIRDYLFSIGYNVITSLDGTIFADPHLGNFENCLKAVEACDVFLGIIRPYCGTGKSDEGSITFQEFQHARACHKPSWFVIDSRVGHFRDLFFALKLKQSVEHDELDNAIRSWVDLFFRDKNKAPGVLDLFEPDRKRRYFDPECFAMQDFVNQKDVPRDEVVNNWMQDFDDITDIQRFLRCQFIDKNKIEQIIKEA